MNIHVRKRLKFGGIEFVYSSNPNSKWGLLEIKDIKKQLLAIARKQIKLKKLRNQGIYIQEGVYMYPVIPKYKHII